MGYIQENLSKDEVIVYQTRLHWMVLAVPVVSTAVLMLPAILLGIGSIATHDAGMALGEVPIVTDLGIRVPDQVSDFADGSTALLHACEVGF